MEDTAWSLFPSSSVCPGWKVRGSQLRVWPFHGLSSALDSVEWSSETTHCCRKTLHLGNSSSNSRVWLEVQSTKKHFRTFLGDCLLPKLQNFPKSQFRVTTRFPRTQASWKCVGGCARWSVPTEHCALLLRCLMGWTEVRGGRYSNWGQGG